MRRKKRSRLVMASYFFLILRPNIADLFKKKEKKKQNHKRNSFAKKICSLKRKERNVEVKMREEKELCPAPADISGQFRLNHLLSLERKGKKERKKERKKRRKRRKKEERERERERKKEEKEREREREERQKERKTEEKEMTSTTTSSREVRPQSEEKD